MKKTPKIKLIVTFAPEVSRERAAKATAEYTDEQAAKAADEFRSVAEPIMENVQMHARYEALKAYDHSPERQSVADSVGKVVEDLQRSIDSIEHEKGESFFVPDAPSYKGLEAILSASVLLCYPSWKFSEELTDREIVFYGKPLIDKYGKSLVTPKNRDLLRPFAERVFCRRETTEEYVGQSKVFGFVAKLCLAAAKRLKQVKAHDAALLWLEIIPLLEEREKTYRECLSPESAAEVVRRMKACFERFRLELIYATL